MAVVDELVTILGLEVDDKANSEASKFEGLISATQGAVVKLGSALIAAQAAISAYTVSLAGSIDAQGKFSDSTGVAVESLQALGFAVQIFGGTTDELQADLENLTKTMSSPIPGEYNETLLMLGVSSRKASGELKTADEVLLDLSDRFQGLSAQRAVQFGDKLGLSAGTVRLLRAGREEIQALTEKAKALGGVLGEEAALSAAELNDSLLMVKTAATGVANRISVSLFPAIADTANAFTDWIVANKELVSSGLDQFINGVSRGFEYFFGIIRRGLDLLDSFLPEMESVNKTLDATNAIAVAVASALGILSIRFALASAPILLVGAAIAGVVLLIEDFIVTLQGGDSVINRFIESAGVWEWALVALTGTITGVTVAVKLASKVTKGWAIATAFITKVMKGFRKAMLITGLITTYAKSISLVTIATSAWAAITSIAAGAVGLLTSALGVLFSPIGLIIAGLIALGAAIYDLYQGLTGGDSAILDWIESFFGITDLPEKIKESFSDVQAFLSNIFSWITDKITMLSDSIAGLFDFEMPELPNADELLGDAKSFFGITELPKLPSADELLGDTKSFFGSIGFSDESEQPNDNEQKVSVSMPDANSFFEGMQQFFGMSEDGVAAQDSSVTYPAPSVVADSSRTSNNNVVQYISGGSAQAIGNEVVNRAGLASSVQQITPGQVPISQ